MQDFRPSIRHGRIVFAWINDRNGYGKLRPAVIVTADEELRIRGQAVVVAVTTTFPDPPPEFCVPLPWHPRGHPTTRLRARSAAVVNWLAVINPSEIVGFGGDVPEKQMRMIRTKLEHLDE